MTDTLQDKIQRMHTGNEISNTADNRRRFLRFVAGGMALGLAGCSGGNGGGSGSSKTAKDQVKYQDSPKNGKQCSGCKYFIKSADGNKAGKCKKVKGKIANDGWCSLYTEG